MRPRGPTGHGPSRRPLPRAQRGLLARRGCRPPHRAPGRGDRQKRVPVAFCTFSPTMAADAARLFGSGTVALSHGATSLGWVVLSVVRGHWPLVLMGCGAAEPQDLTPRPADPSRSPGDAHVVPGPPSPLSGLLPASDSHPQGRRWTVQRPRGRPCQSPGRPQEPTGNLLGGALAPRVQHGTCPSAEAEPPKH